MLLGTLCLEILKLESRETRITASVFEGRQAQARGKRKTKSSRSRTKGARTKELAKGPVNLCKATASGKGIAWVWLS